MSRSLTHTRIANFSWNLSAQNHVTFNLEKTTYYHPIGLTFLAGFIVKQMEVSRTGELIVNEETVNYLERMDFFKFIDDRFSGIIEIVPERPSIHRHPHGDSLVEFSDINIEDQGDLEDCIEKLANLCSKRANYVIPYTHVNDVFAELLDNTFRHSGCNGHRLLIFC